MDDLKLSLVTMAAAAVEAAHSKLTFSLRAHLTSIADKFSSKSLFNVIFST